MIKLIIQRAFEKEKKGLAIFVTEIGKESSIKRAVDKITSLKLWDNWKSDPIAAGANHIWLIADHKLYAETEFQELLHRLRDKFNVSDFNISALERSSSSSSLSSSLPPQEDTGLLRQEREIRFVNDGPCTFLLEIK